MKPNPAPPPVASMTFVRFKVAESTHYGAIVDGGITEISGDIFGEFSIDEKMWSLDDVTLLAPLEPRKVYGVGMNSHSYRRYRMGSDYPGIDAKEPPVFEKASSAITGPDSELVVPEGLSGVSGSAELAVIIKKEASNVSESEIFEHVFGYTASFDAMSPEIAVEDMLAAKDHPTFCPIGPCIKTALDTSDLEVTLHVNGKAYHQGFTSDFIWDVPGVVSYLSTLFVLKPRDVILMGAMGREAFVDGKTVDFVERFGDLGGIRPVAYPRYKSGDELLVRIQDIGDLRFNVV